MIITIILLVLYLISFIWPLWVGMAYMFLGAALRTAAAIFSIVLGLGLGTWLIIHLWRMPKGRGLKILLGVVLGFHAIYTGSLVYLFILK